MQMNLSMGNENNIFFENILSKEECQRIESAYFNYLRKNGVSDDTVIYHDLDYLKDKLHGICYPFKVFDMMDIPFKIDEAVKSRYKESLVFNRSFLRIYYKDSYLPIHTDKDDLDLTLTINIGGIEDWPIYISNIETNDWKMASGPGSEVYKTDYETIITPKGSGVCCYGKRFPHWRDILVCNENDYVIQLFCHWIVKK